jgi:quercetin dioxygenase-like cupin family protein
MTTATAAAATAPTTQTLDEQLPALVSAGAGERTRFFADAITVKHRGDALDVWQTVTLAGCEPPVHVHARHDEWLQVVEGRVLVIIGGARLEAGQGDLVFLPKGVAHGYVVLGREATLQVVTSPGGFVEVFTELNRRFGRGGMPCVLAPNHLEVLEPALAEHGVAIVQATPRAA